MPDFRQGTEHPTIHVSDVDPTIPPGIPGGTPNLLLLRTDNNTLYYYAGPLDTDWRQINSGNPVPTNTNHIVILGDSNAYGNGDTNNLHDKSIIPAYPNVQINQKIGAGTPYVDDFVIPTSNLAPFGPGGAANMGIELALGRQLDIMGRSLTKISKFACRGSNSVRWLPVSADLYPICTTYLDARVAEFGPIGIVFWEMGTNDTSSTINANAWQANNKVIIDSLRALYGQFLLVVRLTSLGLAAPNPFQLVVREQESVYVASDSNSILLNTDDIPLATDLLHFVADNYSSIGYYAANEMLTRAGPPTPGFAGPFPEYVGSIAGISGAGVAMSPQPFPCPADSDTDGYFEILICTHRSAVGTGVAAVLSVTAGFTAIPGGSIVSTFGATLEEWITTFQRRVHSRHMGTPTVVANALNLQAAAGIFAFRQPTTIAGTPVDAITVSANNANSAVISVIGTVSTIANDLIAIFTAGHGGSLRSISGQANASLGSLTERQDNDYDITANHQLITLTTGTKAVAGATGTMTAVASGTLVSAYATVAIKP